MQSDLSNLCNQNSFPAQVWFRISGTFEQGVFIAFCLAQSSKPSMSSTPEMTGMDQVQRWHDQMIYFVPAAKQGSYPHPGHPGPGQPVHPMHSVQSMHSVQPGSYVWWPQPFPCELPGVPPTPAVPPAAAPCEAPCPAPCVAVTRETEPKEQGQGCLDASCSTLATPRSTEAMWQNNRNRNWLWPPSTNSGG